MIKVENLEKRVKRKKREHSYIRRSVMKTRIKLRMKLHREQRREEVLLLEGVSEGWVGVRGSGGKSMKGCGGWQWL